MSSWVGNPSRPPYGILRRSAGLKIKVKELSVSLFSKKIEWKDQDKLQKKICSVQGGLIAEKTMRKDSFLFKLSA